MAMTNASYYKYRGNDGGLGRTCEARKGKRVPPYVCPNTMQVLYLGASDFPAWVVAKANAYARSHNLTPFVVYQGMWNVASRDIEIEIIPMCRSEGALGLNYYFLL